jgi:ABC-type multidrug transport system ATPase subunit/pSer/pThr/pTyr-binding forkhead associated (FHA) protein
LVLEAGPVPGLEFTLSQSQIVIGREQDADITIAAPAVSRQHARLLRRGQAVYIEDLDSSNGTFVNGQRVDGTRLLADGDRIGIGQSITLRFLAPATDQDGTLLEMEPPAAQTILEAPTGEEPPQLVVQVVGQPAQSFALEQESITLGRADDNDITIPSRIVSRYHGRLERAGGGYRFVVLPQASNAVLYQDQPLTAPLPLEHGITLQIGQADSPWRVSLTYQAPDTAFEEAEDGPPPRVAEPGGQTVIAEDFDLPRVTQPPEFRVQIAGDAQRNYTLQRNRLTIGRADDNDIVLSSKIVSRHHAYLEQVDGGYRLIPLPDAANPVLFEGRPLREPRRLRHEDKLRIGGLDPGSMVTMTYHSPAEAPAAAGVQTVQFEEKTELTIGRDEGNDIVLDNPVISRFHAQVERVGQRYRVRDLRSSNGTFVNDKRVDGDTWLKGDDTIRIGPYRFVMGEDELAQYDESSGLRVEAVGLNKWVRKDLNILQDISVVFQPREFIVVVGQSGGGKTTLVDAVAGYRPATHGAVQVNDIDVYENFDAIRNDIGYVPQKDIIHMELTVFQALDYAARLRMPPDTTEDERHQRINEVLEDLDLTHRRDTQISELSGGQIKRVSIGVELLTKPGLFFLDEPTSGLDPGTETAFMQLMRRLADQGRTIVLITHATKNVMLADKVVFLARGGYLAWFGPPEEALEYFDQFRSERDRRARDIEFDEIYAILDDPQKGSAPEWAERYRNNEAYQKYIERPLREADMAPAAVGATSHVEARQATPRPRRKQVSSLRQFMILSARNVKILTRDRFGLILMLAAAPLVSLLDVILAAVLGRDPFDFVEGSMPNVLITLFLPTVYGVMVGGLAQMREIVKEQEIYRRERLVNLRLLPYILSKIWVAALLALYQSLVYVGVHYLAFDMPGGLSEFLLIYVSLTLATMAGMMLGLFASGLAPNPNTAPLIIILLMLPQIVLGGALVPIPEAVSSPISTRWAFQAFMAVTGPGSDVAKDACWELAPEQRSELTFEFKNENCNCMGVNALDVDSCNFPGVGQFYTPAIDEPPPAEPGDPPAEPEGLPPELREPPEPPGERPPEPETPPQPERPENEADNIAMAEYFDALETWQAEVEQIQTDYRDQIAAYEAEVDTYQADLEAYQAEVAAFQTEESEAYAQELQEYNEEILSYQAELAAWVGAREASAGLAEAMIRQFKQDFGWTFVNKENESVYLSTVSNTWIAQGIIIIVLFGAILIVQKRKDVL